MSLKKMIDGSNLTTTQKKLFKAMTANQMNIVTFAPKKDTEINKDSNLIGANIRYLVHIDREGVSNTIGNGINYDASTGEVTFSVKATELLFVHYTS